MIKLNTHETKTVSAGDIDYVYIKNRNEKRGTWTSPRAVLDVDYEARSLCVPGRSGQKVCEAFEDVRPALYRRKFSNEIKKSLMSWISTMYLP